MEEIAICYIDDDFDLFTSRFLRKFKYENVNLKYSEFKFDENSYESLLKEQIIKEADILVIDSQLFQNNNIESNKLSGEEFGIIIKKIFPYKEIIIITQNVIVNNFGIIKKYDSSLEIKPNEYFEKEWKPSLDKAIIITLAYRRWLQQIENKNYADTYLIEQIKNSLEGSNDYDNLSVKDIDNLILAFEGIVANYEND